MADAIVLDTSACFALLEDEGGVADAFVAALAQSLGATLIHKDPEFLPLAGLIKHRMLPPK